MKNVTRIIAGLCLMAATILMFSCGSGSTSNANNTTQSSGSTPNTQSSANDDGFAILNSRWTFTDAFKDTYVIDIKDLSRDGESAKADVIKNGNNLGPILIKVESWLLRDGIPALEFKNADKVRITFLYDFKDGYSTNMEFVLWDYKEGYLYADRDALKSEDPEKRISIRKIE